MARVLVRADASPLTEGEVAMRWRRGDGVLCGKAGSCGLWTFSK